MRRLNVFLVALLIAPAIDAAQVARQNVVVGVGEEIVQTTSVSIATVTSPAGTNTGASQVVRVVPEQYGQNMLLRGMKKGEAKLLVESTASRIAEVINVSVVDRPVAAKYRSVIGALANVDGIARGDVIVGDKTILITGITYSPADQARCLAQESAAKGGPTVVCAARLSSAVPAVLPAAGYSPLPSATITEEFSETADELVSGAERPSTWVATVKLGDVPVLLLSSNDRAALAGRIATFTSKLRRAIAEWKKAAEERNTVYPVIVTSRRKPSGYEIGMVWRFDQGTRGETLADFSFDEMQKATMTSGSSSDRLTDWWAASLQDAFRLYFMGSIPLRTGSVPDSPLMRTYRTALKLDPSTLNRTNSAARVARGYTALRWESGSDPFSDYATRVPGSFQGSTP